MAVRDDAYEFLKGKLADGTIKAMELRLLLDLEKQLEEEPPEANPMASLSNDLPFQSDNLIVGGFPKK